MFALAERNRVVDPLRERRGGPLRLSVLAPPGFPRHLLCRRRRAAHRAGLPGSGRGLFRPRRRRRRRPCRDLLRSADAHRAWHTFRCRRRGAARRHGGRAGAPWPLLAADPLLPAPSRRGGRVRYARASGALARSDHGRRPRFLGARPSALQIRPRLRPAQARWASSASPTPARRARRLCMGSARPARRRSARPWQSFARGPAPRRPPRPRGDDADGLPAVQRQALRGRRHERPPDRPDARRRACAPRSIPTTRPISADTSRTITAPSRRGAAWDGNGSPCWRATACWDRSSTRRR